MFFFVLLVSVLLSTTPYLPYIGGCIGERGGIKMASASTPSANEPAKDIILVHTVQLKPMKKARFSGRMFSSGIDVVISSVHSNPSEEVDENDYYKLQETTLFSGCQKLTSTMKLRPEK